MKCDTFLWFFELIESISGINLLMQDVFVGILIAWVLLDICAIAWAMPDIDADKLNVMGKKNVQRFEMCRIHS